MSIMKKVYVVVALCFIGLSLMIYGSGQVFGEPAVGKTIKVGGIFDITGPTNVIGAPFAEGAAAYFDYVNKQGGINGLSVDLISIDYQFDIQKAASALSRLIHKENILALIGWGCSDMPSLIPKAENAKLPVTTGTRCHAVIGKTNPVVFSVADTYEKEVIQTALPWLIRDGEKKGIRPKVSLFYSEPGRDASNTISEACDKMGIDVVIKEFISEKAISAGPQMARAKQAGSQYVWVFSTLTPVLTLLKEAYKIDYQPQFYGISYVGNELIFKLASSNPGKLIFTGESAYMSQADIPGIKKIREFTGKSALPNSFVAGWVRSMLLARGLQKANIKPEMPISQARTSILDAFEKFTNEDMEGLVAPVTFSETNHVGSDKFRLYRVNWDKQEFVEISE
jgi:branched-chain amino acid transport system substrate-binding protein